MEIAFILSYPRIVPTDGVVSQANTWKKGLEKLGHTVTLINMWEENNWKQFDIILFFGFNEYMQDIIKWLYPINPHIVVAPILDPNYSLIALKCYSRWGCNKLRLNNSYHALRSCKEKVKLFLVRSRYEKLYLSSSVGKTKHSGELFELIISELGKENRLIHIGDSYRSDFEIPKKHGIDAIHIPTKIEKNTFKLKEVGIEENIINSFLNNTSPIRESKYYRFGYEKFGMFLWGYSKWLHKSLKDSDIKEVYFFSRDGLIMKKAFDALYNDVQTHYLEVSRRSLRVPILWMNYELSHVVNMISPSKLVSLTTIFDGVGLDINNYRSLIEKYGFTFKTTFDRRELLENKNLNSLYSELEVDIETVSKKEYELLVKYIDQNHLSGKFAIVDIGWSGGMQRYLIETLNKLGIDAGIKGYYIGVADYYKRNKEVVPDLDLNGYLFDFLHDKNAKDKRSAFVGLFETLFLEQGGSVKNYRVESENVTANRLPYEYLENGKPTFEYRNVMDIQRGALDFIKRFGDMDLNVSADTLYEGLSETGLKPKKADIDMFADFRFFDEGETLYLAKPKSIFYYIFHVGNLKRDFLSSRWKIGFMKRLFKISLPYEEMYRAMLKYK